MENSPRLSASPKDRRLARPRPLTPGLVDRSSLPWRRVIPPWVVSGVVHACMLAILLIFTIPREHDAAIALPTVIETKVEDSTPAPNLEETLIGLDPDIPTQFDMPRIEVHSVPGPVNPGEAIGLKSGPRVPPASIPPPAGLGPAPGQGGGVDAANPGKGSLIELPGGLSGGMMRPGGFGGRSGSTREQLLREGGGNRESEAAVARGLLWLSKHQATDGHWSLDAFDKDGHCNCTGRGLSNDIAATAFGLLPMLGAGQTHRPSADKSNAYSGNVGRALKYLMSRQNRQGDYGGGMYAHGLATIAICEAYGMTADPALGKSAQRAINFIVAAQSDNGGWRYQPREGGDTSVVGWQVMALKSAQMAGLDVPAKTLVGASRWLDSCASADGGAYGYQRPEEASPSMTAVGLLCREYLGWGPRNPGLITGVNNLKATPPASADTIYYTYYATQVMHHMGGEAWAFWNPKVRDYLISKQDRGAKKPHEAGSWDSSKDQWGHAGGRIMTTSLSLLTLEVYYRHLPLYRRDQVTPQ
jgi:hypothetical protein